jgi:hypothetical protein
VRLLLAALSFLLVSASALAQSAAGLAGISGIIRDASGSYVPNAMVVVSNDANGIVRNLTTNDAGLFTASALMPTPGYKGRVATAWPLASSMV